MKAQDVLLAVSGLYSDNQGGGGNIEVESLTVTENKTYTAPEGKAYSPVIANVPNTYSASDEGKVVSGGELVSQTSDTVSANDTYDTTLISSLTVNVATKDYDAADWLDPTKPVGEVYSDVDIPATSAGTTPYSQLLHGRRGITKVSLPNAHAVPDGLCSSCTGLTEIHFPQAEYVGANAFQFADNIQYAVYPKATKLYSYAHQASLEANGRLLGVDLGGAPTSNEGLFRAAIFANQGRLAAVILRAGVIWPLTNVNVFSGTPFKNGGTGGTIYIPKSLYDHLGDGTANDYKAATNWSTVDGYGTITWAKIEGSIYETKYVDGSDIPTT